MALADAIRLETYGHGPRCTAGDAIGALSKADRKVLVEASATTSRTAIYRALKKECGFTFSRETFGRHMRQECSCGFTL